MNNVSLPADIAQHIGSGATFERPFQGMASETSIISSAQGRCVLKIGRSPRLAAELVAEQRVLVALAEHRPFVPEPIAFALEGGAGFSLLSYVEGQNLVEEVQDDERVERRHAVIALFARTLRRIHGWHPSLPEPVDWLDKALDRAARHVESGFVPNPIKHPGRFNGMDPSALLADLQAWRNTIRNDLVFGHGDYCLPNVLIEEDAISGVIDWSQGGYADRRADLAVAAWTIRFNLKDIAYVNTFLTAYGYHEPAKSLENFEALCTVLAPPSSATAPF